MNGHLTDLPPELISELFSFFREENGEYQVADMYGAIKLIADHGEQYPVLYNLIELNQEAVIERFKETGEVPPGVKLIQKTTHEGTNVTELRVFHGPRSSDS